MITGVAIRCDNLLISLPKPNRHSDCYIYAKSLGVDISILKDQGFVTHTGKYLDRERSAKYLKRIKQNTLYPIGNIVISEELW